jgi:hypothetical protein
MTIGDKTVKSFGALISGSGSPGFTRSYNEQGQVVFRAIDTSGTPHIITVQMPVFGLPPRL